MPPITRRIVKPANLDLESPGRRDYWVALEHDSIWGDHLIPLTVFVGKDAQPGQGLVSFGSNHGNEYEGPVVLHHLLNEIKLDQVRGRIILIPVLNAAAFRAGTRESTQDDGVNLNRAFIDGAGKNPALAKITHRIARFVRESIWPHVHVVIDLHAGGQVARFAECSSFHPIADPRQSQQIEETARWFGTPLVIIYQNATPGLLPSEAENLGKITIGTELGWGEAVNPRGVRFGRQGVLAAAIHHRQLAGKIKPIAHHADHTQRLVEMVDAKCFSHALHDGHFEPIVECGSPVKAGQTIAYLHDFQRIDAPPTPIQAQLNGIVISTAFRAVVRQGQWVTVVGRVLK